MSWRGEVIGTLAQDTYHCYSRHDLVRLPGLLIQHGMTRTQDRYSKEMDKKKFRRLLEEEGCRRQCRMSCEQVRETTETGLRLPWPESSGENIILWCF